MLFFPAARRAEKRPMLAGLRCIAAAIFCAQCLFSLVIWKAGLSGNAVFYLTYLCPLFRAGDFAISCCMGCLYRSRKEERTPHGAFSFWSWQLCCFRAVAFHRCQGRWEFWAQWPSATTCCSLLLRCCWSGCSPWARDDFPAAFRKAVFVAGRAVALRLSDPSGTDPVYGVGCKQVWSYGTSCGLDSDRIFCSRSA